MPTSPPSPEIDAVLTIAPPPKPRSSGTESLMPRNVLVRHTSSTRPQLSIAMSSRRAGSASPALLNTTSRRPYVWTARSSAACTPSILAASILMLTARPPAALIPSATAVARRPLMSATTTPAPSRANRAAVAAPMPAPPAVTTTTLPSKRAARPPSLIAATMPTIAFGEKPSPSRRAANRRGLA